MQKIIFSIFLICFGKNANLLASGNFKISKKANNDIVISIDSETHLTYGLAYPLTYQLELPANSSSLVAYRKFKENDGWGNITEKTSNDFFNGLEAVRFNYGSSKAYISVAFSSISDSIYLRLINNSSNIINSKFLGISKYYDNRQAVVTTTADDLIQRTPGFIKAFNAFRSRHLWLSCGAVTGYMYQRDWNDLQKELDLGFVEIDSHSSTHKPPPYADLNLQVVGSKNDLINNLNLPPLYKNGNREYIYSYIYPFGGWGIPIDSAAGQNGYLINRTVDIGQYDFTNWNYTLNMFNRVGAVYEVGGVYQTFKGVSDINVLKHTFDQVVQNQAIYHFTIHPNDIEEVGDWEKPYMYDHLDYISNRKNIWYTGFGHLYLYHYLATNITVENYLFVKPDNINVAPDDGNFTLSVSSNTAWQVNENVDWLSVSTTSGSNDGNIYISYDANPEIVPRNATFTINSGNINRTITIYQSEKKYLEITPSEISVESDSSLFDLRVYSNTNWFFNENIDWLSVSNESGNNNQKVSLLINENPNYSSREATFSLTDGNKLTLLITVKQNAKKYLNTSVSEIEFPSDSSSALFSINSNTNWSISKNADWIKILPLSGSNDTNIVVSCSKNSSRNSREDSLTVTGAGLIFRLLIKQRAVKYLDVAPSEIKFPSDSNSTVFKINSNVNWEINENIDWLTFSQRSGKNDTTVSVFCDKNNSTNPRESFFTITGSDSIKKINVKQHGMKFIELRSSDIQVQYDSGSFNLMIISNTNWQISNKNSWMKISKTAGSDIDTINVNYTQNLSELKREGIIAVSDSILSDTLFVSQLGAKYFDVLAKVDSVGGGTVEGSGKYLKNKVITLVATPFNGWKFKGWYDNPSLISEDSVYTFKVISYIELTAKFDRIITGVAQNEILPDNYSLFQNYPNPFNPTTAIKYSIPLAETNSALTTIKIYDVLGKQIVTLVDEYKPAGNYIVTFNAYNFPSGIYYYKLTSGSFSQTRKMVLLK